jgi:hypothetical protein
MQLPQKTQKTTTNISTMFHEIPDSQNRVQNVSGNEKALMYILEF